ncbi:DNA-binding transcriptional regulator [Brachybacterium sp. UMB0905]|uniref:helix-turn-helix domain-containing protein n=1 Tax=Brachybacterium sp. UMB0905 TaxID=2069310 RepID=UPI000C80CEC9|nr:transcriptional regulator [Brachybacterium sp. UMB0905]PMC76768.1 transcriptional regulator [Brachybacterium sp. UMB0905]
MTIAPPERMPAATFRALREYLGLPGSWLAQHLDVGERTVRKWDQGEAPIPGGVADELQRLATLTRDYVQQHAERLRDDPAGTWPFEIPRGTYDLDAMTPATDFPVDWWRNVGARLMEVVPGLWLEWIDADQDVP